MEGGTRAVFPMITALIMCRRSYSWRTRLMCPGNYGRTLNASDLL